MIDGINRKIDYLRLSVTDRCDLRCKYCMPAEGLSLFKHEDILSFEDIERVIRLLAKMGIKKIKLTGGEPTVRKNLKDLILRLRKIEGIEQITLTSNGQNTEVLRKVFPYLDSINISLDTLDNEKYKEITRIGKVKSVLETIDMLIKNNVDLRINVLPIKNFNEQDVINIAKFAKYKNVKVRYIRIMPIGYAKDFESIWGDELKQILNEMGDLTPISYKGNGPAEYYKLGNLDGMIGFIDGVDHHFCSSCNRIRLSASGFLKTCLGYNEGIDLSKYLREGYSDEEIIDIIEKTIKKKPSNNIFLEKYNDNDFMYKIGG